MKIERSPIGTNEGLSVNDSTRCVIDVSQNANDIFACAKEIVSRVEDEIASTNDIVGRAEDIEDFAELVTTNEVKGDASEQTTPTIANELTRHIMRKY